MAVMLSATVDFAAITLAKAINHVATALLEPEESGAGIVRAKRSDELDAAALKQKPQPEPGQEFMR
jgi:hypothetical protein